MVARVEVERSKILAAVVAALIGVCACGKDDAPPAVDPPCEPTAPGPSSRFFVLSVLSPSNVAPMGDPYVLSGIDLDHHQTVSVGDPIGCGMEDYRSPAPGDAMGVDNQLGPLLRGIAGSCDIPGLLAQNIHDGRVLVLVEVSEIDDYVCDDDVSVDLYLGRLPPGVATPTLDARDLLAPGQTFDIDPGSLSPDGLALSHSDARITDGRVVATGLSLNLPLYNLTSGAAIAGLRGAELRFALSVSGGIDSAVLGASITKSDAGSVLDVVCAAWAGSRTILDGLADLAPDATGACQSISIGFDVSGVAAVRGATASP